MCDWFRQVEARGRDGGLGHVCSCRHMQEKSMGLRQGLQRLRDGSALQGEGSPQGHPWPEKPLSCGKAAPRPLVGRV